MKHLTNKLAVNCNKRDRFQPGTLYVPIQLTLNPDASDRAGSDVWQTTVFSQC